MRHNYGVIVSGMIRIIGLDSNDNISIIIPMGGNTAHGGSYHGIGISPIKVAHHTLSTIISRTSVSRPVIAAAAAIAGDSRWVRPPLP